MTQAVRRQFSNEIGGLDGWSEPPAKRRAPIAKPGNCLADAILGVGAERGSRDSVQKRERQAGANGENIIALSIN